MKNITASRNETETETENSNNGSNNEEKSSLVPVLPYQLISPAPLSPHYSTLCTLLLLLLHK